jgi:hypothetical protein
MFDGVAVSTELEDDKLLVVGVVLYEEQPQSLVLHWVQTGVELPSLGRAPLADRDAMPLGNFINMYHR